MRSRRELRDRLRRAGFEHEEVEEVLGRLEAVGLIDDERFAEEFARHAVTVRHSGDRAIASGLFAKGVDRDIVERTVAAAGGDEESRAHELALARASRLRGIQQDRAFQRLCGFLMRRGYPPSVARTAARKALEIESFDN